MQCLECGATNDGDTGICTGCGADLGRAKPRIRRIRAGFVVTLVVVFLIGFVAVLLRPAAPSSPAPSSHVPTGSVEPTGPPVDPARAAIEKVIAGFYATLDRGETVTVSPYVDPKGPGGIVPAQIESSGTTTFSVSRAVVGSETADVFGHESRSTVATAGAEVEFRLRMSDGAWLVSSWSVAHGTTGSPDVLALSEATARDVVGTVLQARQVGDATTLRMLTTERFRLAHSSWFDGEDRSALLTSYRVVSARAIGHSFAVTVAEQWKPTPLTATYTVVPTGGDILVDTWTWK